jgi:hypothetical protein
MRAAWGVSRRPGGDRGQPFDMVLMRIGFSTTSAMTAATILSTAATRNTTFQLPVATCSTFASGTRSDAVPLAV